MKRVIFAIGIGVITAGPANATGGLICTTSAHRPAQLFLVVSHAAVPAVVSVRMTDDGREVPVVAAQSWLDEREMRLDLVDRNAESHEARLRAAWNSSTRSYDGSLWRNGERRWVRCREG